MQNAASNNDCATGNEGRVSHFRFFNYVHYVLAGALAGVVVAGIIAPALQLDAKQAVEVLGAVIGALSVIVIKALRLL